MGYRKNFLEHVAYGLSECIFFILIVIETVIAIILVIPAILIGLINNNWPSKIFWFITHKYSDWLDTLEFINRIREEVRSHTDHTE